MATSVYVPLYKILNHIWVPSIYCEKNYRNYILVDIFFIDIFLGCRRLNDDLIEVFKITRGIDTHVNTHSLFLNPGKGNQEPEYIDLR